MRLLPAIALACLVSSGPLATSSLADGNQLNVRVDGRRLLFGWHGGSPHRVDVSNLVRAATLEKAEVLDARSAGEIDYFLLNVSGPSQAGIPTASNATGTESSLIWLKLKSWKLLDAQSMPYRSFWDSLEPIGEYHEMGGVLTLRYTNKRDNTDYMLRYDSSHPDGKISLVRSIDVE